ncbi:SpoIIE family protein phosphatase [Streptomyces sp. NBC_00237]|uniref:SpoIIE family protein phosphatase n=1 Tax=Streptomyces sp. NBC_00237 TaxID=2975687 RepID=UPI0022579416|nr:SpoIIE family protein phosphatase [Streptomyces sp. NBC_00237]MCX5201278.1 SpoIIE family protein phosphatase [Streptomyces sp. NBC_00237]
MQRDAVARATAPRAGRHEIQPYVRTNLPGNPLAPSAARKFLRAAIVDWTGTPLLPTDEKFVGRLADDACLIVNELVTNAVVHAGTTVELLCRIEPAGATSEAATLVIEVSDHHPSRVVRNEPQRRDRSGAPEYGRGLHLVAGLAESWGVTYRTGLKTVWAALPLEGWQPSPVDEPTLTPATLASQRALQRGLRAAEILAPLPRRPMRDEDPDWINRGALSFLAEASDLLAGQFDQDMVVALAAQLLVPRLADWCAVWLDPEGGGPSAEPRLARVWHAREACVEELRILLEKEPPQVPDSARGGPVPLPWPGAGESFGGAGAVLACRMVVGGRRVGVLMLGRAGIARIPDEVTGLIEDFVRRVALAVGAARRYTQQATISHVLQRALLPSQVAEIPGLTSKLVYQPRGEGLAGGDFYDVFHAAEGRWCFALGDVQGNGPEAAVVTGLVRPWLRLLAREGYQVSEVLDRLNRLLLDDATESADAAARLVAAAGGQELPDGPQARFLSMLYGELEPLTEADGGGVRCTVSSAGHPLPLVLRPDGQVRAVGRPGVLLGVLDDAAYGSETFVLAPGETLLGVTDGVTERRSGRVMFDDEEGLAVELAQCVGLSAQGVAERITRAVHSFASEPPDDDLALLVLQAE